MNTIVSLRRRTIKSPNEIILKKFSLSYSRSTHDDRNFNFHQFHNFWNIMLTEKKVGLKEAQKRIYKTKFNTFRYHPSKEYMEFINRLKAMRIIQMA